MDQKHFFVRCRDCLRTKLVIEPAHQIMIMVLITWVTAKAQASLRICAVSLGPAHPCSLARAFAIRRSVSMAKRLALPTSDHGVAGSNPAGGEILPEPKRRFIAQSLSCSPFHRLEMTEILLKGCKTLTHPSFAIGTHKYGSR